MVGWVHLRISKMSFAGMYGNFSFSVGSNTISFVGDLLMY